MSSDSSSYVGKTLGNWQLIRQLGAGSYGVVYEARNKAITQRRAAVKVLHAHLAVKAEVQRRFINEANAASQVEHENIVQIFDGGVEESGTCYVVMEFIPGQTLESSLESAGKFEPARGVRVCAQIAGALSAAHNAGIVHRDLKPGNILITQRKGNAEFVKVLDFGVAKLFGQTNQTETGTLLGTPLYMAPEQWQARKDIDGRADIYALGMILYRCVTGRLPFDCETAMQLMYAHVNTQAPDPANFAPLPLQLRNLILRMIAKEPDARPGSMGDVEQELQDILQHMLQDAASTAKAGEQDETRQYLGNPSVNSGSVRKLNASTVDRPLAETYKASSLHRRARYAVLGLGILGVALGGALLLRRTRTQPEQQPPVHAVPPAAQVDPPQPPEVAHPPGTVVLGPGKFTMGRGKDPSVPDGPAHEVEVARFAIEKQEVSLAQLADYTEATSVIGLIALEGVNLAKVGDRPAVNVTREQALAYCRWKYPQGRLPSEAEWEFTARDGKSEKMYPWTENSLDLTRANVGSGRPRLLPVDSSPTGASEHGVLNLIGNAAEWVGDNATPYPGSKSGSNARSAVVRGGSAASQAAGLTAASRQFVEPDRTDPFIGFRCAVSLP